MNAPSPGRLSRSVRDFGLTDRAVSFARLYAQHPSAGPGLCAALAGYSNKGRAAHVRAAELLRDPRVIEAIVHYAGLAFGAALAEASARLDVLANGEADWSPRMTRSERVQVENLKLGLWELNLRLDRLDKLASAAA
jgi:hypothetical protein